MKSFLTLLPDIHISRGQCIIKHNYNSKFSHNTWYLWVLLLCSAANLFLALHSIPLEVNRSSIALCCWRDIVHLE